MWVDNVLAIGNSGGFVEPLEATALMVVCMECQSLVETLRESRSMPTPTMRDLYNDHIVETWEQIRDFLALHYKLNTRLDTPFWRQCRADTDMSRLEPFMKFYEENGPSALGRYLLSKEGGVFAVEGYLVMLVGNRHPYRASYVPTDQERLVWNRHRAELATMARQGLDVQQTLACVRHPRWVWKGSQPAGAPMPRMQEATPPPIPSFALG